MSPLDSIYGTVMVGLAAVLFAAFAVIALAAWWYDRTEMRTAAQEFEQSPYGPVRTGLVCNAHTPHQYGLSEDGTHWVCVRGDDRIPVDNDLDTIEAYANGEVA